MCKLGFEARRSSKSFSIDLEGSQGRFIGSNGQKQTFCTNEHPVAAVKLSLSDVATNFRSAIDLWRSQGRFIGLNEENENFVKIQNFQKKIIFLKSILGTMPSLRDLQGVSRTDFL